MFVINSIYILIWEPIENKENKILEFRELPMSYGIVLFLYDINNVVT